MQPLACKDESVAMKTVPNMQVLLCNQYHSAKARSCCHAHNTKHACVAIQPISLRSLSCCYVHSNKHAAVAMQPVSLSQSMQLLPCTHHQICSRCHAANITQLKQEAVAMHTVPNMNCCYATKIT